PLVAPLLLERRAFVLERRRERRRVWAELVDRRRQDEQRIGIAIERGIAPGTDERAHRERECITALAGIGETFGEQRHRALGRFERRQQHARQQAERAFLGLGAQRAASRRGISRDEVADRAGD